MKTENENDKNLIRAFILINSFFFGLLGFLEVQIYNPLWRFNFAIFSGIAVAVLAVLSKYLNKEDCVVTPYIVTSIAFVTSSLPFKVNKNLVNLIWLAEIPILTYAGMKLIKGLYRIASWTLALIMSIKMLMLLYVSTTMVIFMGRDLSTRLIVLVCSAICFYLTRYIYFYQKELPSKWKEEQAASHMYTIGGTAVLLLVSSFEIQSRLITLAWAISAFLLFIVGFLIYDKFFRYAAMGVVTFALIRVASIDLIGVNTVYRIAVFIALGIVLLVASYWYTKASALLSDREKIRDKPKSYASLTLLFITPLIILGCAFLYPSELRREEVVVNRFISGEVLTDNEKKFLRENNRYLLNRINSIYWQEKGRGYKLYENAVRIGIESQEAYDKLAQLYVNQNEKSKAVVLYEKAITLDPEMKNWPTKDFIEKVARLYYDTKDYHGAAENYEKYLKLSPRSVDALYYLGMCYIEIGKLDKAMTVFNEGIRIDPGNKHLSDIYNAMGIIYEKKLMLGEAEIYYEKSLKVNPENKNAQTNLKRVQNALRKQTM